VLAREHGMADWQALAEHVATLRERGEPFAEAYRALEARDREWLATLLDRTPGLVDARGTNDSDLLGRSPAAGAHRAFYRPHGGFPAWHPSDDPSEILDEGLAWAARSDRVACLDLLAARGAELDADVYRGTPLAWAAFAGRARAVERLLELGADPAAARPSGDPTTARTPPPCTSPRRTGTWT
jgi:ankyrin repeat protein